MTQKQKKLYIRRRTDAVLACVSLAALVGMSTLVKPDAVPAWEITVFRLFNHLPSFLFPVLWPFMQYGVFVTIPVVSVIALLTRRTRLFFLLLIGGIGIYFAARYIKELVPRGRPGVLVDDAIEREVFAAWSTGFTSGHAAVAGTIATFVHSYLSERWQVVSIVALVVVAIGRMYVGAHLPLDVLGGLALGVGVASSANFMWGVPVHETTIKEHKEEK